MEEIFVYGSRSGAWYMEEGYGGGYGGGGYGGGGSYGGGGGSSASASDAGQETSESVIEEITVIGARFDGPGSAIVPMGFSVPYYFFGLFDAAGGAGVVAMRQSGLRTSAIVAGVGGPGRYNGQSYWSRVPLPLQVMGATATAGGIAGYIIGFTHALKAATVFQGGNLLIAAGVFHEVGGLAFVGATTGLGLGVAVGLVFSGGYVAGTEIYNRLSGTEFYNRLLD